MNLCDYCDTDALYRSHESGDYLCSIHARMEVNGPRSDAPRPPVTIRPAAPDDQIHIASLADAFWGEVLVESFGRRYQVDALPAFVACDEGEIVGAASYAREGEATDLVMLNVLPQWQGRGVAHGLITAVVKMTRAEGADRIITTSTNDNLPALTLYQRFGFTITDVLVGKMVEHHGGVEAGFADIPVRDEIQMELRL